MQALHEFVRPLPLVLLAMAMLFYTIGSTSGVVVTLGFVAGAYALQVVQTYLTYWMTARLERRLMPFAAVQRDGHWKRIRADNVVPGDRVALRLGSLVPADIKLNAATNLSVNEFRLTGESLPREKIIGDTVYAGSFIATGSGDGTVTETGPRTYYGTAIQSVEFEQLPPELAHDRSAVSQTLVITALGAIAILSVVLMLAAVPVADIALLDLALIAAGIPAAFFSILSGIIGFGVIGLAKEGAILRRLKSLKKLASINLVLSDKTGTLTENAIRVASVVTFGSWNESVALALAASATDAIKTHPLEAAVRAYALTHKFELIPQVSFIPGDSGRRRGTAVFEQGGVPWTVSLGAPATVATLCRFSAAASTQFSQALETGMRRGDHALFVAVAKGSRTERNLEPVALIFLSDALRADAASTIATLRVQGIDVKMLTGDNKLLASEIAQTLGLTGPLYDRTVIEHPDQLRDQLPGAAGFAEVLPKDKYMVVEAGKRYAHVAVTGEEVHDIPAVVYANIGFAVAHSVDALHAAADVILTLEGIAIIARAIARARAILVRVHHYFLYRFSGTASLILSVLVIGVVTQSVPLSPLQILLLAFMTDVPLIALAYDHTDPTEGILPADRAKRIASAIAFALVGVLSGVSLWHFTTSVLDLSKAFAQTALFVELSVFNYLLVYVAHTDRSWFRLFPNIGVILIGGIAALVATGLAYTGILTAALPLWVIALVWAWSFFFMQLAAIVRVVAAAPFSEPTAPAG